MSLDCWWHGGITEVCRVPVISAPCPHPATSSRRSQGIGRLVREAGFGCLVGCLARVFWAYGPHGPRRPRGPCTSTFPRAQRSLRRVARAPGSEAEYLQRAWLFDAALAKVEATDAEGPRAVAVRAAALAGLERFAEGREAIQELKDDILLAAEAGIDVAEFLQHCDTLERQSQGDFAFSDVFGAMIEAREAGRGWTSALLPQVPEFTSPSVEVRSVAAGGRGLFAGALAAGDVVLCGLPLVCAPDAALVPALREAADASDRVRGVLELLSDGSEMPVASLEQFCWRAPPENAPKLEDEQLEEISRINGFEFFGSSAVFGAASMSNHSCCPNAHSMAVGDALFVRASRTISEEEVHISYFDVLKPLRAREERTQSWSFQCRCRRCEFERSMPAHLHDTASVDEVESAVAGLEPLEAGWLRASHIVSYKEELEALFPLGEEAMQKRAQLLRAMEVTDPGSFTHVKFAFLDWLGAKSAFGPEDPATQQAMRYCDSVHQVRYGKVPGSALVSLLKRTQQAVQSVGVGEEFCHPTAAPEVSAEDGKTMLLD